MPTMKVTQTVDYEIIANLLCDAWEGGSDYWAVVVRRHGPYQWVYTSEPDKHYVQEIPLNPGGLIVFEEPDGKEYRLDLEAVQKGLQTMADKYPRHYAAAISGNDDAGTGDVFLQCCLFGEIIYG